MTGFDIGPNGLAIHLAGRPSVEGDLLVCADGLASTAARF
jgi:hypothetical protein